MSPEDALFSQHNLDRIAGEAINHQEAKERISQLNNALDNPDVTQQVGVDILSDSTNVIRQISRVLSVDRGLSLGEPSIVEGSGIINPAEVDLFKPHEIVDSENHPGIQFVTSVIAMDMFDAYGDEKGVKKGKLILLKLDHAENDLTSKDLELGMNFQFGAFIEDGTIKPFKLEIESNDRVIQEVQRSDPTEESGKAVDSQLIQKNGEKLVFSMLDVNENADTYSAVIEELDKFVASRSSSEASQE